MFPKKKRIDHAEEREEEPQPVNFAWILMIGVQMGFSETEIKRMYFGKWSDLFEEYKKFYNFKIKSGLFKEQEEQVSLLDL